MHCPANQHGALQLVSFIHVVVMVVRMLVMVVLMCMMDSLLPMSMVSCRILVLLRPVSIFPLVISFSLPISFVRIRLRPAPVSIRTTHTNPAARSILPNIVRIPG